MPTYKVQAPDGRTVRLTGDSPPTEAELNDVFASLATPTPSATPVPTMPRGVAETAAGAGVMLGRGALRMAQEPIVQDIAAGIATDFMVPIPPPLHGVTLGAKALRYGARALAGGATQVGVELARENGLVPPKNATEAKEQERFVGSLDSAFKRGATGEMLSLALGGLGGKAWHLFDRHGLSLFASMSPGLGGGLRAGVLKRASGKAADEAAVTGEAFNVVLDAWSRGGMSAGERQLFESGRFDELAKQQLDGFAKEMAGAIDPTSFARLMGRRREKTLDVASALHERAIGQINQQVGGQLVVEGKALNQLTGPGGGTAIMGRIGMFPGRNIKAVGGVDADVREVRRFAQGIQFATEGPPGTPLHQIQELSGWLSEQGDSLPYLQLDEIRKNVGSALGTVRRYKATDPAYDRVEGALAGLYSRLNSAQRGALRQVDPNLVRQWDSAQSAYKGVKRDWDSHLMRKMGEAMNPNSPTDMAKWLRSAEGLTDREFGEFVALAPRKLRERYRGGYLDDLLFTRSAEVDKATSTMGLSGKKLLENVRDERQRIAVMFPDDPQMVSKLERFAATVGYPSAAKTTAAMGKHMIELNQAGAVLNLIQQTPSGKRTLTFTVPREALSAVLRDPKASQSFFALYAPRVARGARSGVARQYAADPLLEFANRMSEAMLLSIDQARGAAENSAPVEADPVALP